MTVACPPVSPVALAHWRRIRQLQARELSGADYVELRAALCELGRILGFDSLVVEPHRVRNDQPWGWIAYEEELQRWRQAWRLAASLDAALATRGTPVMELAAPAG